MTSIFGKAAMGGLIVAGLASCGPTGTSERNPIDGRSMGILFEQVCRDEVSPADAGFVSSEGELVHYYYDVVYRAGSDCEMEFGTATPYDQFYQALRAEVPSSGFMLTPIPQGEPGQLGERNYYTLSNAR